MSGRASRVDPLIVELAAVRRSLGLGRIRAAHLAGLSTHTVERWELGKTTPTLGPLRAYMAVLGLSISSAPSDVYMKESSAA